MVFLDFEQPIEELSEQLDKVKQVEESSGIDASPTITELENKIEAEKKVLYRN